MTETRANPKLERALEQLFPAPDEAFLANLETQLLSEARNRVAMDVTRPGFFPQFAQFFQTRRWAAALLAVLLALILLFAAVGPARVIAAVRGLFGYVPNVGFVEQPQAVLQATVAVEHPRLSTATTQAALLATDVPAAVEEPGLPSQEQSGITVAVTEAVAEADRLVIVTKVTGLPNDLFSFEHARALGAYVDEHPDDPVQEQIRLPDGTLLDHNYRGGGNCGGEGDAVTSWLTCKSVYAPLPQGVTEFTLEIGRLPNALPGELPEDWRLPVRLEPAAQVVAPQEPGLVSDKVNGLTLLLLKAAQTPSETAFQFGMEWEGQNRMVGHTAPITLRDSAGRYYLLYGGSDSGSYTNENPNFTSLSSMVTTPIRSTEPLTFSLDWAAVSVFGANAPGASFTFDPGPSPQIGQEWALDQPLQVGDLSMKVVAARLKQDPSGQYSLEFDLHAPEDVYGLTLFPRDADSVGASTGVDRARNVLVSIVLLNGIPTGPITLDAQEASLHVTGSWQIVWAPEKMSFPLAAGPTPAPTRLAPPLELAADQPLLQEVQALLDQGYASFRQGPGWVHVVKETRSEPGSGMLDTGEGPLQPPLTTNEEWYQVDAQGLSSVNAYLSYDPDGKLVSASFQNGTVHFSLPDARGGISPDVFVSAPALDNNLLNTLSYRLSQGQEFQQEEVELDGKPCLLFTLPDRFDPPQAQWGETEPVKESAYQVWIDRETGRVVQSGTRITYVDGSSRYSYLYKLLKIELVDQPSQDVMDLLNSVVMP